ncbi:MAG TPA: hypothetical protein VFG47_23455 [Geminicoccaceae bacterium]|nr:hypothetical protein [Geminicoccaceae bacterium]
MDETTARAELPNLDIEIRHRRLPEEHAEYLSISLRATPSFGAVARHLEARNPMLAWAAVTPLAPWAQLVRAAWAPWLAAWSGLLPGTARPDALPEAENGGDVRYR